MPAQVHPALFEAKPMPARSPETALPAARIYRVSPQWADHVAATVSNGTLVSYPAPSDISPATAPVALADGWMLDRQGLNPSSVFLRWTRSEYSTLSHTPSPSEIMAAIEPGSRLEALYELPMTAAEAAADTSAVNRLIAEGLPGCRSLLAVFHLKE